MTASAEKPVRQVNWRGANLAKYTAHLAVQRALVLGTLEMQSCEVCGSETVDAHHDRYDEPLNVRWLCRRYHVRLHHYGEDMFPAGRRPSTGSTATTLRMRAIRDASKSSANLRGLLQVIDKQTCVDWNETRKRVLDPAAKAIDDFGASEDDASQTPPRPAL